MMHMLRRIFAVLLVLAALLSCAFADDSVEPCADVTFLSATCSLGMDKVATFTLMTDILAGRIVVTNAWLEQQSNGRWVYVKPLAVPATIATNTISYSDPLLFQRDYDQRHVPHRLHCGCGWPSNHPLFQQPPFHLILFSDSPALFPFWHPAASFSAALLRGIPLSLTRTKNSRRILI
mgnify:CR=1 FL=1